MSGCYLRISGKDLDGPALARNSAIPIDASWRRGDQRSETRTHRSGGLRIVVSKHDGAHVPGQIEDALAFLTNHRGDLAMLIAVVGVDQVLLDFAWDVPVSGSGVQWNRWPPALLKLCGELGIAIEATAYVVDR
ncbi:MAG: hypothetical protein JNK04_10275 [Myxococcales bacterium]|nr:hypothetical protein [Myxococcales bacterium]